MSNDKEFGVFNKLIKQAQNLNYKKIVLPEGDDERVIWAINKIVENNVCKIIVLGNAFEIEPKLTRKAKGIVEIIDPQKSDLTQEFANLFFEMRKNKGVDLLHAKELMLNNIYFGTMLVKTGRADGMVAGCRSHTADVLRPAFQIIRAKPGILKASSCFIVESSDIKNLGENGFFVFADCAVNEKPTAEELADIAISSSETAIKICGMQPKVAMLSYSSKSTSKTDELSDDIKKVKMSCEIISKKMPQLIVDGELQSDAALLPAVSKLKSPDSKIKGKANVLVFPDLNSGNIAYKLVQIFGNLKAVGPIIQGLNKPINDLSRSSSAKEIYLTIALTVLQTQ